MRAVANAIYAPVPVHEFYGTVGLSGTKKCSCICAYSFCKKPMCAVATAIYAPVLVQHSTNMYGTGTGIILKPVFMFTKLYLQFFF